MTNDFEKVFDTAAEPEDYTGEDGLLYCGKCRTSKERYSRQTKPPCSGVTATRQNVTASGRNG